MTRIATKLVLLAVVAMAACSDDGPKVDAAPPATNVCSNAAPEPFLTVCTSDATCGTCMCKSFGHAMVCTKSCTGDGDCPSPSGGCSAGFCRP